MKEYYFTDTQEFEEYIQNLTQPNLLKEYNDSIFYIKNNSLLGGSNRIRFKELIDKRIL